MAKSTWVVCERNEKPVMVAKSKKNYFGSNLHECAKSLSGVSSVLVDSAQDSDLALLLGDRDKVKNFLRLSHLYYRPGEINVDFWDMSYKY